MAKRVNKKIILKNELGDFNIQLFLSTTALGSKVQKEQTPGEKRAGDTHLSNGKSKDTTGKWLLK